MVDPTCLHSLTVEKYPSRPLRLLTLASDNECVVPMAPCPAVIARQQQEQIIGGLYFSDKFNGNRDVPDSWPSREAQGLLPR